MKSKYYKIIVVIIVVVISGILYSLYLYNKPFKNIEESKADLELTAQFLIEDYQIDETDANAKYLDKLIQLEGEISDISINNGNSVITINHSTGVSSVICNMLPKYNINALKLKKGDAVVLKGICTGYLLDIILINCVLVKNK